MISKLQWGVVRYNPTARKQIARFDGWYALREDAAQVWSWWRDEYPNSIVALIQADKVYFPETGTIGYSNE